MAIPDSTSSSGRRPSSSDSEDAFERALEVMSSDERAALHDEARGRALREDPTLKGARQNVEALIRSYMRDIWEEQRRTGA